MQLLIIGGTRFLGRHLAEQALAAGHELTLLHRGISNSGLFPKARHLLADRNAGLDVLAQGQWDAVIDTSAYRPRQVLALARALGDRVGQYQLVSSISVYADTSRSPVAEDAARATLADPATEVVDGSTYGGLKALCEDAARQAFGARCLVSRPGLIVGPFDPSGRFTWWVARLQRGGQVLAPGRPDAPVQFIDARDAAAWMLLQATHGGAGTFNLTGPEQPFTMGALLDAARATLSPGAALRWVDEAFLLQQGVAPWTGLPLWLPQADAGLHRMDIGAALATGLRCRPLADTLRDTAAWAAAAGAAALPEGIGLPSPREQDLLQAWQGHAS